MDTPILLLSILLVYFVTICILKKIGYKRKIVDNKNSNCCPKCNGVLDRVRRKNSDHLINILTFQMFGFKRYSCNNCGWNGLRWENKF